MTTKIEDRAVNDRSRPRRSLGLDVPRIIHQVWGDSVVTGVTGRHLKLSPEFVTPTDCIVIVNATLNHIWI